MRALKIAAIIISALVAIFVVVGLLLPSTWHVERAITINAPPQYAFTKIVDLRTWPDWTVWTKERDPSAE